MESSLQWIIHSGLACLSIGVAARAQATITVPNGANLAPYIAAASPGDTLLLGANHPNFTLNKGLNLFGAGTRIVPQQYSPLTSLQIPAGQRACLVGLDFTFDTDFTTQWGSDVNIQGDVRLANCSFFTMDRAMTVSTGTVLLSGCQLYADFGGDPLLVTGGVCSVVNTTATGNDALEVYRWGYHHASPGIRQTGGTLWIAHSTLIGGDVGYLFGYPTLAGKPALLASGGTAFVVDSTLTGGAGQQFNGSFVPAVPAIQAAGGVVKHARCNLIGGGCGRWLSPSSPDHRQRHGGPQPAGDPGQWIHEPGFHLPGPSDCGRVGADPRDRRFARDFGLDQPDCRATGARRRHEPGGPSGCCRACERQPRHHFAGRAGGPRFAGCVRHLAGIPMGQPARAGVPDDR